MSLKFDLELNFDQSYEIDDVINMIFENKKIKGMFICFNYYKYHGHDIRSFKISDCVDYFFNYIFEYFKCQDLHCNGPTQDCHLCDFFCLNNENQTIRIERSNKEYIYIINFKI